MLLRRRGRSAEDGPPRSRIAAEPCPPRSRPPPPSPLLQQPLRARFLACRAPPQPRARRGRMAGGRGRCARRAGRVCVRRWRASHAGAGGGHRLGAQPAASRRRRRSSQCPAQREAAFLVAGGRAESAAARRDPPTYAHVSRGLWRR